ncbi:hypothetical protein CkaCkLH20_12923 [Colletotrichum karsti]|uniref:Clr5 domain-containing protein n=1 Tax=Colletotrichum karsti TaxID=1095194 RepID=A0A9P6LE33_9PEZI|nr:uncharacterized protein CkaCkLH20_12923 [Colletotrichum karsti]KAF9869626.1 hypothetical protein CkaCkLH20_12923 [Colletotrichum karsti]
MGYDWDAHEKLCFQLYINEKRSLEDIMEYLKVHHDFRPCKRAFQTQFRKWDFPSKRNPAHKNGRLVARVKELWERNLSQRDMLTVLNQDGFDIKKRELVRVRTMNGWLMKAANGERMRENENESRPGMDPLSDFAGRNDDAQMAGGANDMTEILGEMPDEDAAAWDGEKNRRKRRRLKAWESTSQDVPVAPRFPSETTLDEAKAILDLSNDVYRQVRATFSRICEESGISKKSIAGPDKWEAAKDRLVREMPQLRDVMSQSEEDHKSKKLALDVICADITKRARTLDKRVTLAEIKTILGVNPEETREMRSTFEQIAREAGLGSKSEAGPERWSVLIERWQDSSPLVQRVLAHGPAAPGYAEKERALDVLARDVMKRLRDEVSRKDKPSKGGSVKAKQPATSFEPQQETVLAPTTQPEMIEDIQGNHGLVNQYGNAGQVSSLGMVPSSGDSQTQMLIPVPMQSQAPDHLGHSAARILSNALLGQTNMGLDSHLGSSLLMSANAQAAFVSQQYAQQFTASQPIYHAPPPPAPTAVVAIYLRLHPSSTFVVNANLWIATLGSHSMQELRHVAASKFPGALCLRVEGVIKDGKGGEMPLQIDQDPELAAYLAHLQGATPVFNVQLVPGWKTA